MKDTTRYAASSRASRSARSDGARFGTTEIIVLIALVLALFAGAALSGKTGSAEFDTGTIQVEQGSTLWQIAQEHPVGDLSTARTVDLIVEMNDLEGADLAAGTVLMVPTRPESQVLAQR